MTSKKNFAKRILSMALVLLMVLSLIPTSVMAADTDQPWLDSSVTATMDGITLYIPEVYCDDCGENVQDAELVIDSVDYAVGTLRVKYHLGHHPCFEISTKSNTISIDNFDCTTEYNEYPVYANAWDQTTTEPVAYLSREAGHIFDEGESGICTFCGEMVQTGWVYDSGNWYYYYEDGTMATNVVISNENGSYYFGSDGALVVNQMVQVDDVWYQAAEDGRLEPLEIDTHNYVNGFCTDCDAFEPATDENEDGVYEISNAGQLYWFADKVNNDNANYGSANAILTADIVVNEGVMTSESTDARVWTPIGDSTNSYSGKFEGNSKTVSGLYFKNSEVGNVGLFGCINGGTVNNLGVINSYLEGDYNVGGIVAENINGSISKCYNTSEIIGSSSVGGVVGCISGGSITNCYNAGKAAAINLYAGGVVGICTDGTITNCFNASENVMSHYYSGAVIGLLGSGTVTDCYYLKTPYDIGIGYNATDTAGSTEAKTLEQFKSGEVAYLLQGTQKEEIWGQKIGTDEFPSLGGDKVYRVVNCIFETVYSNIDKYGQHNIKNGICTVCNAFEPATDENEDGVYEIGNAGQLYWFADKVNNDNANFGSADAILTADIVVNEGVITSESTDARVWTPIGIKSKSYTGIFDGNNKTISGLYVNDENKQHIGLFGYVGTGCVIKSIGIINSYFKGLMFVGGVVGYAQGITITNCYNTSSVVGQNYAGGVAGYAEESTVANCYNTGVVDGNDGIGMIGWIMNVTVENCYYLNTSCYAGIGNGSNAEGSIEAKTADAFASGEVAYLLQGTQTEKIWGQTIGTETAPVLGGDKVYYGYVSCADDATEVYTNNVASNDKPDHKFDNNNGFCTVCGEYQSATDENEDGVYEIGNAGQLYWFADKVNNDNANFGSANAILTADIVVNEGVMTSESTDARVWTPIGNWSNKYTGTFDGNDYTISGLYFNDSNVNCIGLFGYVDEEGVVKNTGVINSCFIGNNSVGGVVGENLGKITNCYNTGMVSGIIAVGGVVGFNSTSAETSNCYNSGDVSGSVNYIGGVVGYISAGTITNCYNIGLVNGGNNVGGVVGHSYTGTITNCYNTGRVEGLEYVAGVIGFDSYSKIDNCYNTGQVSGDNYVGGVGAYIYKSIITNCYYLDTAYAGGIGKEDSVDADDLAGSAEAKTAEQFKSGEVAYLLQGEQEEEIWGQRIGTDTYPVLGGDKVYYGYTSCVYDSEMVYTNTEVSDVRPAHKEFRAEFIWDEPYDGECYVSVELYCTECGSYVDSDSGYATIKETVEAQDCMHPGSELYEITLEYKGLTYTDTKSFTLKSDNHIGELVNGFCTECGGYQKPEVDPGDDPEWGYDDVYLIYNAGQLYWFADYINNVSNDAYAKLAADIVVNETLDENSRVWTPMIDFYGTFDGNGHIVSGIYVKSEEDYIGMFGGGYYSYGTIENLGLINSYFEGNDYVGGIAGYHAGTIKNCYVTDTVTVVGNNLTGTLVGNNAGTVSNCYAYASTLVGSYHSSYATVENCYYLADTDDGKGGKTAEQFASGEVAYLLQAGIVGEEIYDDELGDYVQAAPEEIWGQKIGTDQLPALGGDKVYTVTNCKGEAAGYSNTGNETFDHNFVNGFCTLCGGFEPATLNEDGVYEIGNAGQLYWFADKVNNDYENFGSANAILTADIVVNEGVMASESTDARAWTPIGNTDHMYTGTFDGNNKTVSGLYFNNAKAFCVGLFGRIGENGAVKNTGVINSYFKGLSAVGGVVGSNNGTITNCYNSGVVSSTFAIGGVVGINEGTITSCYNTGIIEGNEFVGGVTGTNYSGTITNCYNTGEVSGSYEVGGVVGKISEGIISNCYNIGKVSGANDYIGGVAGANQTGTITNCYYLDTAYAGGIGMNDTTKAEDIEGSAEAKTAEQFKSGEVAYLLQGTQTEEIWGQKIGEDTYPVFGGDKVYTVNNCKDEVVGYSNTEGEILDHDFENGFCTVCDIFVPATDENEDGVYEIANAGQLYWFAEYVNAGNVSADAILTADIVVNEGTVTESSTDARVWTPIGNNSNKYTGTFDGNDYTVSGLYFNDSEVHYVGLFGVIGENGAVKNTSVINSYFNADKCVGGVSGYNFGTVTNCYNTAEISADNIVGGIVGCNYGIVANSYNTGKVNGNNGVSGVVGVSQYGTIINCYNTGEVSGTSNVGGILGESYSATIANCYNTGTVNGNYYFGAIFGYGRNYDASNCYYLDSSCSFGTGDDSVYGPITSKAKTSEAFASGEVAYLLGDAFGQKIGTDTYPVLSGDKVYYVTNCKSENIYSNTNENDQHNVVDDSCTNCGLSSSTVMEIKLIKLAIKRANEIADENNVLESKKEPLDDIYQELLEVGKQEGSGQFSWLEWVKIELSAYNQKLQAGIADGTWVKADYTEIDAAVAEIESSGATTDKMSAKLDAIKSELSVMKESSETSKADVDVLMKEVETLKDCVSGNHIFENGKCTICGTEEHVDKLAGYSLSLDDKIAVNYYMSLTEKTLNDANAKMVFTVPDTGSTYTLEIPVSKAVKSGDYYVFTCEVAAKEMTSVIKAKLVTSESELQLDDYTVQEYAEVILSDTVKYAKEQELVKKMLNYGTEAQIYFNYNTDNLANDTDLMTEEEKITELYGFAGAPFTLEGEETGVTYYGTALSLETELAFKHYFIIDESVDTQSLEITCNYPVTLKKNGSFYELIISDIPAHKMGEGSLKVSLGGITLDYTIYSYGALAQNSGKEALWTVVSALAHFAGEATMYAYK